MKKFTRRRASAMLLAVIFVILAAGLGGAFFAFTSWKSKSHFLTNQSDDALQICDAGLEMARAALLQWRNADDNKIVPPATSNPYGPDAYSWNKVFRYCADPATDSPLGMGITADPEVIKADAMLRLSGKKSWVVAEDNNNTYDSTGVSITINTSDSKLPSIGKGIKELFGVNRKYGKGAFHVVMKNDDLDYHGNGVDNGIEPTGNVWGADKPWTKTDLAGNVIGTYAGDPPGAPNYGTLDPLVDGNGTAILIVTATLPDGTVRQIVATISFPFPGNESGGAIKVNGDISMNGSFQVLGTLGSVYANGNISGNGSATAQVSQFVAAAGSTSGFSMLNPPPGGIKSGAPPLNIEPVAVKDYRDSSLHPDETKKMFLLDKYGKITYVGTSTPAPTGDLSGFSFKNGAWKLSGQSSTPPPNAVYYVEGDFSMTGQGNAPAYNMTLIAEGSISLGGNSKYVAATKDDGTSFGTLALAGQDVQLNGTGKSGTEQYQGSVWANEQLEVKGNFILNGSATGANSGDTPGSKVSSQSAMAPDATIGGNPTVVWNGGPTIVNTNADHLDLKYLKRTR
jgi:hypothetical protein